MNSLCSRGNRIRKAVATKGGTRMLTRRIRSMRIERSDSVEFFFLSSTGITSNRVEFHVGSHSNEFSNFFFHPLREP